MKSIFSILALWVLLMSTLVLLVFFFIAKPLAETIESKGLKSMFEQVWCGESGCKK